MRFASFTFDDGSITGARKVDEILNQFKATFFIVTGWVKPNNIPINDRFNLTIDHGNIDDWIKLSKNGHDIQSHTHSHIRGTDKNINDDCENSLNFIKKIHDGPYTISTPFNSETNVDIFKLIRLGTPNKFETNDIFNLNLKKIYSCDYEPYKVLQNLDNFKDNSWLILAYHSIDNEGFCPIKSKDLEDLKNEFVREDIKILTINNFLNELHNIHNTNDR